MRQVTYCTVDVFRVEPQGEPFPLSPYERSVVLSASYVHYCSLYHNHLFFASPGIEGRKMVRVGSSVFFPKTCQKQYCRYSTMKKRTGNIPFTVQYSGNTDWCNVATSNTSGMVWLKLSTKNMSSRKGKDLFLPSDLTTTSQRDCQYTGRGRPLHIIYFKSVSTTLLHVR
jgi:hypothetical protein